MSKMYKQYTDNYTQLRNTIIEESTLSWKAKGIYAYLSSKPDKWDFYIHDIARHSTNGKEAIRNGIKELEKVGLLERKLRTDDKGIIRGHDYFIYDEINHQRENPSDGELGGYSNTNYISNTNKKNNTSEPKSSDNPLETNTDDLVEIKEPSKSDLKKADLKARNNKYLYLSKKLSKIIRSNRNVVYTRRDLIKWCDGFRKLEEINKVSQERMVKALEWYSTNIGKNKYSLVIHSGEAFYTKFIKLESAMDRAGMLDIPIEAPKQSTDFSDPKEKNKRGVLYSNTETGKSYIGTGGPLPPMKDRIPGTIENLEKQRLGTLFKD